MYISQKFIKATDELCDFGHPVPAPYFRKEFMLDFTPDKAEITICGLGFYELTINGEDITKGFMAPYVSNPEQVCYYDNYDITDLLSVGKNVIGITLGNGMRNCYGGFIWDLQEGRAPLCTALAVEAENGSNRLFFEADESFKVGKSPILYNDTRMGYMYDSNLETDGWNLPGFDASSWENAKFCPTPQGEKCLCEAAPLVSRNETEAVSITHYDRLPFAYETALQNARPVERTYRDDVYVYDFGYNFSGVTKLKINGQKGQRIKIRHGEYLQGGCFSINTVIFDRPGVTDLYYDYGQADEFICKGGEEEFIPRFKYDGFRYAYVEGLTPEQATKEALTFVQITSDLERCADFKCSDDTLNKLFEMISRADISNFCYFPTDCPHREKNGWTGDAQASAERYMLTLNPAEDFKTWLRDIRHTQRLDGMLPGIVPTYSWGYDWGNGPMWDAVCAEIPYNVYRFTGDTEVIKDNAPMMLRYLSYVMGRRDERGLVAIGLGDWLDPFGKDDVPLCPLEVSDTTICLRIAQEAEKLFLAVGKRAEADFAAACAKELREAIRSHLIDFDTCTVSGDCQAAQSVVMWHGVFNENEYQRAAEKLVEIIHRDGDINTCGFIGLRYIFHLLTSIGEAELAYKIIVSEERSCYGYWVKNGYTTMIERFQFDDGREVGSQNHHFLGDIGSWMIQEVAGIQPNPELNGVDTFVITPHFLQKLSFAEATYTCNFGTISVKWERSGEAVVLKIRVPQGMHGSLKTEGYSCNVSELTGGEYEIICEKI